MSQSAVVSSFLDTISKLRKQPKVVKMFSLSLFVFIDFDILIDVDVSIECVCFLFL